jgi:hypothetical protein
VFHPAVAVATIQPGTVVYQAAWSQAFDLNVAVFSGIIGTSITGTLVPNLSGRQETGWGVPCPDQRGYWGDYNNHLGVYQPLTSGNPLFWTAYSDSTDPSNNSACDVSWEYTSSPVHVSATWISYP